MRAYINVFSLEFWIGFLGKFIALILEDLRLSAQDQLLFVLSIEVVHNNFRLQHILPPLYGG